MKERINYLDVAKFIGIFCIFLGHCGTTAGKAYYFVFAFHVPLFFFVSGCTENLSARLPFHKYIIKNIKTILIPFYLFAVVSVVLQSVLTNTHAKIISGMITILNGCIRNHFFASGLWFLTCLFVIKIAFYILRKLLRYKSLILLACLGFHLIAQLVITPKPIIEPHLPYNLDSACYYVIFYALGYYCFGFINSFLAFDSIAKKVGGIFALIVSFGFSAALFFGKNLFDYLGNNTLKYLIDCIFKPLIVILFVLIVSKLAENISLFVEIGKNTLFLCGTEYIIKTLVPICLQIVGLDIGLPNPVAAYIYTFALLILCHKTLVPAEKLIFKKLKLLK